MSIERFEGGERWLAIYGAMVANQVSDLRRETSDSPTPDQMLGFIEEAEAVADLEAELFDTTFVRPTEGRLKRRVSISNKDR